MPDDPVIASEKIETAPAIELAAGPSPQPDSGPGEAPASANAEPVGAPPAPDLQLASAGLHVEDAAAQVGGEDELELGINLAGGEFGEPGGTYGKDYIYPDADTIAYYADQGLETVRLPLLWERLQPTIGGELDQNEIARVDAVIEDANAHGMKVILDVHNYGYGYGSLIGSEATPNTAFADFWGKVAGHYTDNPHLAFGLMNEPHEQSPEMWLDSANAAIAAIREAGADHQILVPGTAWTGAWTWVSSGNAEVIGNGIIDPAQNFAFEVHQYLDKDGSGTSPDVVSPTVGVERLAEITAWAEETGSELYLAEFGVADDPESLEAMESMLTFMQEHDDVWQGATYWAGGPWWGDYMFSAEPEQGHASAQMQVLDHFT